MACGPCSGGVKQEEIARVENSYSQGGGYTLRSFPGTDWYRGKFEGTSVWVAGRHTDKEKLFPFSQLAEASSYVKGNWPMTLDKLPTAEMTQAAVESVYG